MIRRLALGIAAVAATLVIIVQLIPVSRSNPPVSRDVAAPPAVAGALRRGCYDCHSNETRWPPYARVAPISWLAVHDVNDGRKHLNFSTWDKYSDDPGTVAGKLRKIGKVIGKDSMPPWYYVLMHPDARLSGPDRSLIAVWVAQEMAGQEAAESSSR